jgi:uncharacterized repeat protein (TIGR01451 family)
VRTGAVVVIGSTPRQEGIMTNSSRAATGTQRKTTVGLARATALGGLAALLLCSAGVQAEGSRNLYPSNYTTDPNNVLAGRGHLNLSGNAATYFGTIAPRTFLYVYAEAGEYILLGSRNRTADGTGPIRLYLPQDFQQKGAETIPGIAGAPGSADFTCDGTGSDNLAVSGNSSGRGLIATRDAELAGPRSVDGTVVPANSYTPCYYRVTSTGIHGVLFSSSAGNTITASVTTPATSNSSVSAWDVTVRPAATDSIADINGRVFTYAWAVATGGNLNDGGQGRRIYSDLYYVTLDGYRYRQRAVGIDPNAGVFFANTFGFLKPGDEPLYKDVRGSNQNVLGSSPLINPRGITAQRPQFPIFFNDICGAVDAAVGCTAAPNAAEIDKVLTALSIPTDPKPPQVNSFQFTYPPTTSSTAYVGQGGSFTFSVTDTISFEIVISRDGVDFDPANPQNRVLTGKSGTGTYSINWDGKDNAGNNFPVGTNYQFRISGRNGEVHFPFADVEGNFFGGPILTKLNGNIKDSLVYFDDRGYTPPIGADIGTLNGSLCGNPTFDEPTPPVSLVGVDSSLRNLEGNTKYARNWDQIANPNSDCNSATQGFGDSKGLDLWTYQVTVPQSSTLDIIDFADVIATVNAPVAVAPGGTVLVNVGFGNVGSQNAANTTYAITLPAGLSGVSCGGATCVYNAVSGAVTITGLPGSLSPGQFNAITLSYTAPASGSVQVSANVGTSTDQGPNLAPDSASAVTLVGGSTLADVLTTLDAPTVAVAGGSVAVEVRYSNIGASDATATTYSLSLPSGLSNVSCSGGPTCSYNSGTGVVTVSGLPATLGAGSSLPPFFLNFDAPASGAVAISSVIGTASAETTTANNTAAVTVSVLGLSGTVDVAASVDAPATAAPGSTVSTLVSFQNVGGDPFAGATYALTLPPNLTGVSCLAPVTCSYNSGSGAVTVSGLSGSLGIGESVDLTLRYTAPTAGVVDVVATANVAGDVEPDNNSATGRTTVITAASGADVTVTVTPPAQAAPGATVNVPVQFANLGPATAADVDYTLSLSPGLSGVSCSGSGVSCTYNSTTGVLSVSGAPASLTAGQSVPFTVSYTAPGPGSVTINASTATSTAESNLGNNSDNGVTQIVTASTADVTTTVSPPPSAVGGSTVNVPVTYSNVGAITAAGVSYTLTLAPNLTGVACSGSGISCTYDSGTGVVTLSGAPASLNPGQSVPFTVSYTAPAGPATVPVTSTVGTSTPQSNTGNDTATASTTIASTVIDAVDDNFAGTPVNGLTGGSTATVFGNDTLGGNPFLPAAVTPTVVNTGGITGLSITAGGVLQIPAGTPAGPYTVRYRICEVASPANCDEADVSIVVAAPLIDAVNDNFSGTPVNSRTGGTTPTVFTNDTLNGAPFLPAAVTPSLLDNDGITGLVLNPDGTLTVPANAPPGTYDVVYRICEVLNPANCDTATVTLVVAPNNVPNAIDDIASTPVNTPVTVPVTDNDGFGDDGPSTTAITIVTPPPVGTATVDDGGTPGDPTDDSITFVPPPDYEGPPVVLVYRICDADGDCDEGTVTITVGNPCAGNGTVSGVIFRDGNRNGTQEGGESGERSLVSLVPTTGATRIVAADASGNYSFANVPAGSYQVIVLDSYLANVANLYATNGERRAVTVTACTTATASFGYAPPVAGVVGDFVWYDVNQSGVVDEYFDADGNGQLTLNDPAGGLDESTFEWVDLNGNNTPDAGEFARCGLAGVTVELLDMGGSVLGTTTTNARGAYRFLNLPFGSSYRTRVNPTQPALLAGAQAYAAGARCIATAVNKTAASDPGTATAKGAVPPVGCGMTTATLRTSPVLTAGAPVFDELDYGSACGAVIGADLAVLKSVSNANPTVGSTVTFTVSVRNNGPAVATNVLLTDSLPSGYSSLGTTPSQGTWNAPTWSVGTLAVGQTVTLSMQVRVLASGSYMNTASVAADQPDPTPDNDIDTEAVTPGAPAVPPAVIPVGGPAGIAVLALLLGGLGARRLRSRSR